MRLALQTLHRAAGDSGRLVQPEGMALDSLLVESLELCMGFWMLEAGFCALVKNTL